MHLADAVIQNALKVFLPVPSESSPWLWCCQTHSSSLCYIFQAGSVTVLYSIMMYLYLFIFQACCWTIFYDAFKDFCVCLDLKHVDSLYIWQFYYTQDFSWLKNESWFLYHFMLGNTHLLILQKSFMVTGRVSHTKNVGGTKSHHDIKIWNIAVLIF